MNQRAARTIAGVTGVLGLALIVFGVLWMTTLFPRFEKIPSDKEQTDELQGKFTVVHLTNGDEAGDSILQDPAVRSILGNPQLWELIRGDYPNPFELLWSGSYLSWISIGVGIVLVGWAAAALGLPAIRRRR